MKGKILLTILFLAMSFTGMSQAMWIMIFGDKLSNDRMQSGVTVSIGSVDMIGLPNASPMFNWAIGGFSEIRINKKNLFFAFDFAFKSPFGAKNLNSYFPDFISDTSVLTTQDILMDNISMSLPLYLKYKTRMFGFGIGPQISYIYKSKLEYKAKTESGKKITVIDNGKELIHKFDVGAFAMAEIYLTPSHPKTSMRISLRYYFGFLDPIKNYSGVHNSTLMATFGIPIGGKSKIKTTE